MGEVIQFPRTQYLKNINKRPKLSEEEEMDSIVLRGDER